MAAVGTLAVAGTLVAAGPVAVVATATLVATAAVALAAVVGTTVLGEDLVLGPSPEYLANVIMNGAALGDERASAGASGPTASGSESPVPHSPVV